MNYNTIKKTTGSDKILAMPHLVASPAPHAHPISMTFIIERDFPTALASRCEPPHHLSYRCSLWLVGRIALGVGRWASGVAKRINHMVLVIRASSQLPQKPNEEKKPHGQVVRGTGTRITRVTTDQTAAEINFYNSFRFTVRFRPVDFVQEV